MKHRTTEMAWRDAQAREIADARTIVDLQAYLHESLKAYEAREMHWDGIYRGMRETAESQKHRITQLEAAVQSQKHVITQQNETLDLLYDEHEAQKHRITELERSLAVQKEWTETYRNAWSEADRTAKDRKHKITALTDAHNAQLRINSQQKREYDELKEDYDELFGDYIGQKVALESQQHRITDLEQALAHERFARQVAEERSDDFAVTLEEGTEAQRKRNAARQEQMDFKYGVVNFRDIEPEGSGPFGF